MCFSPRLRLLVAAPLMLVAACTTEPTPVTPPGEGYTVVENRVRGLTNGSLLTAHTATDGTVYIGGNISAIMRREPGGEWALESISPNGIVTGLWQDASGQMLATAGTELHQRNSELGEWSVVPLDTDAILLDVWGLDGETMFVGGTSGTILRHHQGTWHHAEVPVNTEIWGFAGTSPSDLIAVGQNGTILESDDGGATWSAVDAPTSSTLFAVAADGAGRVVAVGSRGTVLLREGDTWEATASPTDLNLFEVRSGGPGEFIIAGDGGQLFVGNGLTWQPIVTEGVRENFRAITGAPGARTVAGWFGTVLDEGSGWAASETGTRLYGAHAPAGGTAMVVGQGGVGYERRAGGWQRIFIPSPGSLFAIAGPSANDRIAVGDSGGVLHYNGASWQAEQVPADGLLRSVWYDGSRAMAVGADGTVLVREQGAWRRVNAGTNRFLRHVGGRSWDQLYIAGDSGILLHWNGSDLRQVSVPTTHNLRASWMRHARDVYVVGDVGTLLHFDGWQWTKVFPPTLNDIRTIHAVGNHIYIGGDHGQIHRSDGNAWVQLPVDQFGFWLFLAGEDELIAVGELGTIAEGVK